MGWAGKENGELLRMMVADGFAGFVTVDQNIPFQQNVAAAGVAVLVLVAATNRRKQLQPLMPALLEALATVKPGELVRVGA